MKVNDAALDEVVVIGYEKKSKAPSLGAMKEMPASAPAMYGVVPYSQRRCARKTGTPKTTASIPRTASTKSTKEPLSTFSIDVDAASTATICGAFLKNYQQPPKDAIRIEEMVNYFNYEYPEPEGEHPFEVITEISDCPWQPNTAWCTSGIKGKHIPMDDCPPPTWSSSSTCPAA